MYILCIKTENIGWPKLCIVPEAHQVWVQWTPPHLVVWNAVKHKASCHVATHVIVHIIYVMMMYSTKCHDHVYHWYT